MLPPVDLVLYGVMLKYCKLRKTIRIFETEYETEAERRVHYTMRSNTISQ